MPTVLRHQGFRFHFYSHEPNEPPHVHVDRQGKAAKFWIEPVGLARNYGFTAKELTLLVTLVRERREEFLENWHGYFGSKRG